MAEGVLTSELGYHKQVAAAMGSTPVRLNCKTVNGTSFKSGQEIRIQIPALAHHHLQQSGCYLKFKVRNGTAVEIRLDGAGIASLISRWSLYHGSQLIEDVNMYSRLYNQILDVSVGEAARDTGPWAVMAGTAALRTGNVILAGATEDFCLPMFSSILGSGNAKYVPLSWLGEPLLLSITLSSFADAFVAAAGTDTDLFEITSCELIAQTVKLSDDAEAVVRKMNPNGVDFAIKQWKVTRDNVPQGVAASSTLIPFRLQSLSGVYVSVYESALMNNVSKKGVVARTRNNIATAQLRIGSVPFPSTPIDCTVNATEPYAELLKATSGLYSTLAQGSMSQATYIVQAAADNQTGTFLLGFNCDSLENYTKSQNVMSGMRTVESNSFVELTYSGAGTVFPSTVMVAVEFDAIMSLNNGQLAVRF